MATYWENSCLIVSLVFSHLGFWSGSLFLIAPFPDLCLLVLFCGMQFWYSMVNFEFNGLCSAGYCLSREMTFKCEHEK